jgi:hypothetical protein
MRRSFLIGTFTDPDMLRRAILPLRRENFRIFDVYSPYPVHGLDEALGIRRTRLPWVTLLAGLTGLATAFVFENYTAILDWNLNVGGKPNNSILAFLPICFELTVLFGALGTVAALFLRSKLFPGRKETLIVDGITNDTFALVLRNPTGSMELHRARRLLEQHGAREITEKEADL